MKIKSCCFIGHRNVEITEELKAEVKNYIEYLIKEENVKNFLIGSRSNFNYLCHSILEELKEKFPSIKLIAYECKSEAAILKSEKRKWEKIFSEMENKDVSVLCVDEIYDYKNKYTSGKAAYIERNQAMIDDSDFCLFYFDKDYIPLKKNFSISNSGTAIAYIYAERKKKIIKNFFDN